MTYHLRKCVAYAGILQAAGRKHLTLLYEHKECLLPTLPWAQNTGQGRE